MKAVHRVVSSSAHLQSLKTSLPAAQPTLWAVPCATHVAVGVEGLG